MSRAAADRGCLVYVGNLPDDVRERELDDLFSKVRAFALPEGMQSLKTRTSAT
jgi:hypothetical protein